jgi:hypothetical protein
MVVIVEHIMIFLKLLLENLIDDIPLFVVRGEKERKDIIKTFEEMIRKKF